MFDLSGAGLGNVSMDLLNFLIHTLKTYYPLSVQYVLVHNLPWVLRSFWPVVKMWLGDLQHLVKFSSGDQIRDYIDEENLPRYLGGKCTKNFAQAPKTAPGVDEVAPSYGFTHAEVKKYMKVFDPSLQEAKKLNSC